MASGYDRGRPSTGPRLGGPGLALEGPRGAGRAGGTGLAHSANTGKDTAIFEAVHGSAPKHAGKNDANPTALILSAVMMLRHLGEQAAADRIERAVLALLSGGEQVTYDLGGSLGTSEFADAVIAKMSE